MLPGFLFEVSEEFAYFLRRSNDNFPTHYQLVLYMKFTFLAQPVTKCSRNSLKFWRANQTNTMFYKEFPFVLFVIFSLVQKYELINSTVRSREYIILLKP